MVGAVGIGLKATLKARKLLILLNEKNAKNTGLAQPRYTRGTRRRKTNANTLACGAQRRRAGSEHVQRSAFIFCFRFSIENVLHGLGQRVR